MNWVLTDPIKKLKNLGSAQKVKNGQKLSADHFNKELDKLLRINPMAAEYPVAMNYVEFMLDLAVGVNIQLMILTLKRAKKILDHDHFGLKK